MLFVEQKVNLNFLPNPKHEVPVWAIWSPKNLQEYLGHRSLDWWSWCPEEVQDCCMWRYQSVLPMFSSVRGFWIIFFCVLLFFITIICAPCFFGVFFLGGEGLVSSKTKYGGAFFPFLNGIQPGGWRFLSRTSDRHLLQPWVFSELSRCATSLFKVDV